MRIRALDAAEVESVSGTGSISATVAITADGYDSTSGTLSGWLKTPSNVGLASVGVTEGMLTTYTGLPSYTGTGPNITGNHYRRIFNLSTMLAPGDNSTFTECLIRGSDSLVNMEGTNITFQDCDFEINNPPSSGEHVVINGNYYYAGSGTLTVKNCRMVGGTIFINLTSVGSALIEDVYGYGQQPETGGQQHRDGFTCRGASQANPIILRRCRFDCDQNSTTGAFFLQDTYGSGVSGLTVEDCMFEGSGYCVAIENVTNLTFTNNRMRPHGSYSYGPYTKVGGTTGWVWNNNNVYANTPPEYRGAVVNA